MKRIICLIMSLIMCAAISVNAAATEEIVNNTQNVGDTNETELIQDTEEDAKEADNTENTENTGSLEKTEEENNSDINDADEDIKQENIMITLMSFLIS